MAFRLPRRLSRLAGWLACAALAGAGPALAFTPDEAKAPMTVTLVRGDAADCGADCPEWLALTGAITPATPALLNAALARIGQRHLPVLVDSPGGAVRPAMAMGRAIRARGLDVVVAGTALTDCAAADRACAARRRAGVRPGFVAGGIAVCASACSLLLAAGTSRDVGENSYVGVHQISAKQTIREVRTLFSVLRRRRGDRIVTFGRRPVSARTVASRTVQVPAPEAFYTEVRRYLAGMGIGEAILPLMRSTPPSGIHWMSAAELAGTRLATDTTDARTLVARAAHPAAPPGPTSAMALASAALGPGPGAKGIVDWRVDPAPGGPTLIGTVDVPGQHLHGTVSVRRETAPGATNGFVATVDFGHPTAIEAGRTWTTEAPIMCDGANCNLPFIPVATRDDGQGRRDFGVIGRWSDWFLSALRDRDRLTVDLSAGDGRKGWVTLSLAGGARAVVADWENRCCGLAPRRDDAASAPLASFAAQATVSLTGGGAIPRLATVTLLTWTALQRLDRLGPAGMPALRGTLAIPTTDIGLTLEAAPTGDPGFLAIDIRLASPSTRFGPALSLKVPPVWSSDRHVAVLTETAGPTRDGRGFHTVLSIAEAVPDGADLVLEMTDLYRHDLTLTLPIDGPLRSLFRTLRRGSGPAS